MAIEGNVALAFGLVIAAGLCTSLGATLVFCTSLANHRVLAAALGASAGVMMYVSMVEIFTSKAIGAFEAAGMSSQEAMRYATFSFFLGILATYLLGKVVNLLAVAAKYLKARRDRKHSLANLPASPHKPHQSPASRDVECGSIITPPTSPAVAAHTAVTELQRSPASGALSCKDAEAVATNGGKIPAADPLAAPDAAMMLGGQGCCECGSSTSSSTGEITVCAFCDSNRAGDELSIPTEAAQENPELARAIACDHHSKDLARMGLLTGLAVGLHNLPEGLATFVATLASPSAGIAIAVAIALHNIPEGVVVAMPIYYATRSKWKAFAWSFVSGLAEPIGGLLAYAVLLGNGMSPLAFAIMFGFVAGMMVYISVRELIPTALRYDPEDKWVTSCCIWGMAVMASSLLLFSA